MVLLLLLVLSEDGLCVAGMVTPSTNPAIACKAGILNKHIIVFTAPGCCLAIICANPHGSACTVYMSTCITDNNPAGDNSSPKLAVPLVVEGTAVSRSNNRAAASTNPLDMALSGSDLARPAASDAGPSNTPVNEGRPSALDNAGW